MVRASVVAEKAGVPAVSIVSTSFMAQATAVGKALGISAPAIAEYPGVIMTESDEEVQRKVEDILVDSLVKGLTTPRAKEQTPWTI